MINQIKTTLRDGQKFVDDPVYVYPRYDLCTPLTESVAAIFGTQGTLSRPLLTHYERTRLRWMRPDGNGGLIPR